MRIDFWICFCILPPVNEIQAVPKAANPRKDWQKTPFANLIRYVASGTYYARFCVKGKLSVRVSRRMWHW